MGNFEREIPQFKIQKTTPISNYIADLYCHSQKLIIEIDGSIHLLEEVQRNDEQRQRDLEDLGIKVIRFTNNEIRKNRELVLQTIEQNIK